MYGHFQSVLSDGCEFAHVATTRNARPNVARQIMPTRQPTERNDDPAQYETLLSSRNAHLLIGTCPYNTLRLICTTKAIHIVPTIPWGCMCSCRPPCWRGRTARRRSSQGCTQSGGSGRAGSRIPCRTRWPGHTHRRGTTASTFRPSGSCSHASNVISNHLFSDRLNIAGEGKSAVRRERERERAARRASLRNHLFPDTYIRGRRGGLPCGSTRVKVSSQSPHANSVC
jgi:hypothetical protein